MKCGRTCLVLLAVGSTAIGVTGCSDARVRALQAQRRENIRALVARTEQIAADRRATTEWLVEVVEDIEVRRPASFDRARTTMLEWFDPHREDWVRCKPACGRWFARVREGNVQDIPRVAELMFH